MHQIPVDTIIVYIKTNKIPPLESIQCSIVFWEGFYCFFVWFFSAGKILMVLLLLQNYSISQEFFFIKNYFFSQLLKYYVLHGLIYSFLSIWDFKNKWEMC